MAILCVGLALGLVETEWSGADGAIVGVIFFFGFPWAWLTEALLGALNRWLLHPNGWSNAGVFVLVGAVSGGLTAGLASVLAYPEDLVGGVAMFAFGAWGGGVVAAVLWWRLLLGGHSNKELL